LVDWHESWKIRRALTKKITNASINEIYEAGISAGALGGRLLGAGGGGFMLFYVRPERREALRTRLKKLLCVPLAFSNRGSHVVVYEPEEAYDKSLATERRAIYAPETSVPVAEQAIEAGSVPNGLLATAFQR
jgi:GHMP kinases C terminal